MKPEIKAKWVAALRSGEYIQGRGSLRNYNKFCCLGVLCDVHAKETGGSWGCRDVVLYRETYLGMDLTLPEQVIEWAGLTSEDPNLGYSVCSRHNDGGGPLGRKSFPEIADLIEENL